MKRNDYILAAAIFLFAGALSVFLFFTGNARGDLVTVTVDKQVYGTYSLDATQDVVIDTGSGHNVIHIENGTVSMTEADCPDGYCKRQGAISTEKEAIVCLPHKLVVEIRATTDDGGQAGEDYDLLVK